MNGVLATQLLPVQELFLAQELPPVPVLAKTPESDSVIDVEIVIDLETDSGTVIDFVIGLAIELGAEIAIGFELHSASHSCCNHIDCQIVIGTGAATAIGFESDFANRSCSLRFLGFVIGVEIDFAIRYWIGIEIETGVAFAILHLTETGIEIGAGLEYLSRLLLEIAIDAGIANRYRLLATVTATDFGSHPHLFEIVIDADAVHCHQMEVQPEQWSRLCDQ